MVTISPEDALLVVDLQRDFCFGGALAVAGADEIIPVVQVLVKRFVHEERPVLFSRDWHPVEHCSFAAQGGPWPPHCVAGTAGAAFPDDLEMPEEAVILSKATTKEKDAYSAFEDTGLAEVLRGRHVKRLFVAGLATDYCVRESVLDGLSEGFQVMLVSDAVRGVDVNPGDSRRAMDEMVRRGALPLQASEVEIHSR